MKPELSATTAMSMPPSPASQPATPAMPRVPVPLDELLKIANEFIEGNRLAEAEKLLDHIISATVTSPEQAAPVHHTAPAHKAPAAGTATPQ